MSLEAGGLKFALGIIGILLFAGGGWWFSRNKGGSLWFLGTGKQGVSSQPVFSPLPSSTGPAPVQSSSSFQGLLVHPSQQTVLLDDLLQKRFPAADYIIVDVRAESEVFGPPVQDGPTKVARVRGRLLDKGEIGDFWKVFVQPEEGNLGKAVGFRITQTTEFYQKIGFSGKVESLPEEDFQKGEVIESYIIVGKDDSVVLILK